MAWTEIPAVETARVILLNTLPVLSRQQEVRNAGIADHRQQAGLLLNALHAHCLRFMPALNTTSEEVHEGMQMQRRM
jgi:acetylornithine/succinyldiaminopimelate/putrescine aminotransferase